jgi:hypothetical protein
MFALTVGRSPAGDEIWETRVIPNTTRRNPALREYMLSRMKEVHVIMLPEIMDLVAFEIPTERVNAFLIRVTKGLLHHFHRSYDYRSADFQVRHIEPTEDTLTALEELLPGTAYEERGDGVVRFRHGITDSGLGGVWLYIFYDAIWYLVFHTTAQIIQCEHKPTLKPGGSS